MNPHTTLRRLVCRLLGHHWVASPIQYAPSTIVSLDGRGHIGVTWICDETCSRCGGETWWPS